ncbi:MAG TPA: fructosamine kinase family protein [Acidimicrobiales bacterium]|nr:fructosamine kinase family protein [Acidimicrobiales bacterium]
MASAALGAAVAAALGRAVRSVTAVGGGCISDAGRVELAGGLTVFAKAAAGLPAGLLEVEAAGLAWLGEVPGVRVPEVVAATPEVLVLEWVEPGARTATTDEVLGRDLAALHGAGAAAFGWHRDGFIGIVPQRNTPPSGDWCSFWITRRIEPLVARAVAAGTLDPRARPLVDRLADRLPERAGPAEPPARVHGDLWHGNVHVDRDGRPWLVDPAAYGGHREVDLAMLGLFGSPSPAVAAAYDEVIPRAAGWRERQSLWQLEPLLTHTVMFGGSYGASALGVLDRFSR